jgi:hypothetical protein
MHARVSTCSNVRNHIHVSTQALNMLQITELNLFTYIYIRTQREQPHGVILVYVRTQDAEMHGVIQSCLIKVLSIIIEIYHVWLSQHFGDAEIRDGVYL